jgi:hypothetical protein
MSMGLDYSMSLNFCHQRAYYALHITSLESLWGKPDTTWFNRKSHPSKLKYRMFHLKRNPNCYTWTPLRTKRRNSKSLQPMQACKRYGHAFRSCVARWTHVTDKHFLYPVSVTSRCIVVLLVRFLSGYWLLNVLRTAAKCLKLNTRSACDNIMFISAKRYATSVSRNLATNVTSTRVLRGSWDSQLRGVDLLDFILYRSTWLLLGCTSIAHAV